MLILDLFRRQKRKREENVTLICNIKPQLFSRLLKSFSCLSFSSLSQQDTCLVHKDNIIMVTSFFFPLFFSNATFSCTCGKNCAINAFTATLKKTKTFKVSIADVVHSPSFYSLCRMGSAITAVRPIFTLHVVFLEIYCLHPSQFFIALLFS